MKYKDLSPPLFIEEVAQAKRCDGGVKPVRLFFVQELPCNILQHHSQPRDVACDSRICYTNRQYRQQLVVRSADVVYTVWVATNKHCQRISKKIIEILTQGLLTLAPTGVYSWFATLIENIF